MVNNAISADTKVRILEAAQDEFAERGFDGARVDSIAAKAKVNKALIYYYFESKERLLQELLSKFLKDREEMRKRLVEKLGTESMPYNIASADVDFLFSQRNVLRIALMEDLKKPNQTGVFLKHWVDGLVPAKQIYADAGYSFRYTPRVIAAMFFYQLIPTVSFATLGESLAVSTGIELDVLKKEFLQLVQETMHRHYHAVFAESTRDPTPEVSLPLSSNEGDAAAIPGHLLATAEEKAKTLAKYIVNGRMTKFPLKEKCKVILLEHFSALFDPRKTYGEKQVNEILMAYTDDYVRVRRYLVEYGYLGRRPDGSAYWSRS